FKKLCPEGRFKTIHIEDEYAVLVGGYRDMEAARRALDDIKKFKPSDNRLMNMLFARGSKGADAKGKSDEELGGSYVSPFMDGFVTPNPTVAMAANRAEKKPDAFLKQLNANEEYSLLKCRESWTLAVANIQCTTVVQSEAQSSNFLKKLVGGNAADVLGAGAM